jgi:heme exporter protein CcmD
MNWAANHAGFVAAAYALTGVALVGLIAWVLSLDRAQRRKLAEAEARKP